MRLRWTVALFLAVETMFGSCPAQAPARPSTTSPENSDVRSSVLPDENFMQVPVLALSKEFGPLPALHPNDINISLDSGPAFHPTELRVEGNDPISLAIVLDASGSQDALLRNFAEAAKQMASSSLGKRDTFTLFAVDCRIVRTSLNQSVEPSALKRAVYRALTEPDLHAGKKGGACSHSLRLWDAAAFASKELAKANGRRVLLVVSNGEDRGSTTWWNDLRAFAADQSITIVGLRDLDQLGAHFVPQFPDGAAGVYYLSNSVETRYRRLCEMTGGLILATPAKELSQSVARLIAYMKGRYILEFPRPQQPAPGGHTIDVTLPGYNAYVVVSGVTITMPNAGGEAGPSTTASTVMGNRRILPKPE